MGNDKVGCIVRRKREGKKRYSGQKLLWGSGFINFFLLTLGGKFKSTHINFFTPSLKLN